jgi:peptidoglycan L-alanyl-D-glutamate endopeptidase CwlK
MNESSLNRLAGVHPDLRAVILRAAELPDDAPFSFVVTEGRRTIERQRELYAAGKSQTMASRHLTGHAVDLAVIIGGKAEWALQLYTQLARIVGLSATALNIPVVWGGCWVKVNGAGDLDDEMIEYMQRCKREGRRPFIDGPHFELDKSVYS